jgi:hypothetical protein
MIPVTTADRPIMGHAKDSVRLCALRPACGHGPLARRLHPHLSPVTQASGGRSHAPADLPVQSSELPSAKLASEVW